MTKIYESDNYDNIIQDLNEGKVVGFPTETVYGLAIVYDNVDSFNKLYEIKNRSITKPISMMVASKNQLKDVAILSANDEKIIDKLMPGPITLVMKACPNLPYHVTFNLKTIGVRIPDHKIALDILRKINKPLLVTSANISGNMPLYKYEDVYKTFDGKIASLIAKDANNEAPSTVFKVENGLEIFREGPIKKETIERIINMKKVAIGNDHGGVELKNYIIEKLSDKFEFINCGTDTLTSVDYPDYAFKVGEIVASGDADFGIVICKSGIGVSIAANKVRGVRCALVYTPNNASLAAMHNKANVIALGASQIDKETALEIINTFSSTSFEERHQKRIDKITEYESK